MKNFKNHWYYWHTGNKLIAVTSVILSTVTMWLLLVVSAGFSVWGIIIAVILDVNSFLLVLIYFLALRPHIPDVPDYYPSYLHFREKADEFIEKQFVLPIVAAFFVSRLSTFFVAKFFRRNQPEF
jgi:hypothetical protein